MGELNWMFNKHTSVTIHRKGRKRILLHLFFYLLMAMSTNHVPFEPLHWERLNNIYHRSFDQFQLTYIP